MFESQAWMRESSCLHTLEDHHEAELNALSPLREDQSHYSGIEVCLSQVLVTCRML